MILYLSSLNMIFPLSLTPYPVFNKVLKSLSNGSPLIFQHLLILANFFSFGHTGSKTTKSKLCDNSPAESHLYNASKLFLKINGNL